jgi:hypothetical protein
MALSSMAFTFGLLLLVPTGWASAMEQHSGVVVAVDETQITIDEMGPWHGPATEPMRHVFRLTDGTSIALAERTREGSDGWPWAFNDQPAQLSDLRPGDFVTVTTEPRGRRTVALRVLIVAPGTHLDIPGAS